eukprot:PhF_6_TR22294/c0_g1_i3/m.31547
MLLYVVIIVIPLFTLALVPPTEAPSTAVVNWKFHTQGWVMTDMVLFHDTSSPTTERLLFGSGDNNLYCLDAVTGAIIWNVTTGSAVMSTPYYDSTHRFVFFGSNDCNLYCVTANNGTVVWKYQTHGQVWYSSPKISLRYSAVYVGGYSTNLTALDIQTGVVMWQYSAMDYVGTPSVCEESGVVYVGSWDTHLYVLDALRGTLVYAAKYTDMLYGPILLTTLTNPYLYVTCFDGNIYCVWKSNGTIVWQYNTKYPISNQATLSRDNNTVYIGTGTGMFALNALNGSLVGQQGRRRGNPW